MKKYELIEFLKPFMDETEIAVLSEGDEFPFILDYQPTGFGIKKDEAAVIIRVMP